jgi:peptidyl-prolyl cis-trans isomerase C
MEAGTLGIFLGKGDGTFQAPFYIGAGPNPGGILVENLHGQPASAGRPDLVAPDQSGGVMVLINTSKYAMPYLVNGQRVPEAWFREEEQRLGHDLRLNAIADEAERARQLRIAAQNSAIDRMLVEQATAQDPRPIDAQTIEQEVRRQRQAGNRGTAFEDSFLRQWVERQFRLQRTHSEMVAGSAQPAAREVEAFYEANRENFRNPETFHAAHIVKHVNREHSAEGARAGIEAALAELERGQPFAEVAERHSDCKGNGGDLGQFPAGQMVQEFEDAIRALEPGQRTGIFTTPFGFHIAELRARTDAGAATFEEVRADIGRILTLQSQHQVYLRAVAELRCRADIRWESAAPAVV